MFSLFARLLATNDKPYVPGWDNKREVRFNLSGVKFSMLVPYSNAPDGANMREGEFVNIYDPEVYPEPREDTPDYQRSPFRALSLFGELWESVGALVGGRSAGMFFNATVLYDAQLPSDMTCFDADHFRQLVDRDMYFTYGPPNTGNYMPLAPVDWQVRKINSVDWVYYRVLPDMEKKADDWAEHAYLYHNFCFLTPISDRHYICLSFMVDNYTSDEDGSAHCVHLLEEMVSSVHVGDLPKKIDLTPLDICRPVLHWRAHTFKKVEDKKYGFVTVLDELGTLPPTYVNENAINS